MRKFWAYLGSYFFNLLKNQTHPPTPTAFAIVTIYDVLYSKFKNNIFNPKDEKRKQDNLWRLFLVKVINLTNTVWVYLFIFAAFSKNQQISRLNEPWCGSRSCCLLKISLDAPVTLGIHVRTNLLWPTATHARWASGI